MGYNGFGMRREVYTRKPKIPFQNLKKLTDVEFTHHSNVNKKLQNNYSTNSKKMIHDRIVENNKEDFYKNIVSFVVGMIIIVVVYILIKDIVNDVL